MTVVSQQTIDDVRTVLHWYDFLCPFCYVGQQRNGILAKHGLNVIELAFQAHPDIPSGGAAVGPRIGPMYEVLERDAKEAGLPLRWPSRLPNTRRALAAAEWTRRYEPKAFPKLLASLFEAHFALGEDIGQQAVIDHHASASGVDLKALHSALTDGSALRFVDESEQLGHSFGVQGTPAWRLNGQLVEGLRSEQWFTEAAGIATLR